MANLAANRVRQTGMPFTFQPMSANERRIIHLTLADSTDLFTESIGEGSERKLRIGPSARTRKAIAVERPLGSKAPQKNKSRWLARPLN